MKHLQTRSGIAREGLVDEPSKASLLEWDIVVPARGLNSWWSQGFMQHFDDVVLYRLPLPVISEDWTGDRRDFS